MTRIHLIDPANTTASRAEILAQINAAFGATPNMFKAVANSPAALAAMWGAFGALGKGTVGAKLGEQIAVAVAEQNKCNYCLAAHTALGKGAGLTAQQLSAAQAGQSGDPQVAAALDFAIKLVSQRGQVGEADVVTLRSAGYGDEQIVEILAHVALNIFTNYVNVAFAVPLDFAAVPLLKAG